MPFTEILGHGTITEALQRTIRAGRSSHAYLFTGIDGCGKKKTALALIQAIFCGRPDACGSCPSCRKVGSGTHPDIHVVETDGTFIKIEQIRELQRELSYRPFEAPLKACIIDEADRLNTSAGNSLLKTLEDPPGNALMILIASSREAVLPTIASRCQHLQFRPLPQRAIEEVLLTQGCSADAAKIAASLAGGSLKMALELAQGESGIDRRSFIERIMSLSRTDMAALFNSAEEYAVEKEKALTLLELLTSFLRDVMLLQSGSTEIVNADLLPILEREASMASLENTTTRIQYVREARQALMRNVNARLTLDFLFMRLAR